MRASTRASGYRERILQQLLQLRAAGGEPFRAVDGPGNLWRWGFRAAGWPIVVDLDTTVLELRVYHGNDLVVAGSTPEAVMNALLDRGAIPAGWFAAGSTVTDSLAALRAIVAEWKKKNARLYTESPRVARHSDGWNNA